MRPSWSADSGRSRHPTEGWLGSSTAFLRLKRGRARDDVIDDGGVVFHAWVSVGGGEWIFDPTTYQLAEKMAFIDAYDGIVTPIDIPADWSNALLMRNDERATWEDVRDGRRSGVCCYDPVPALTQVILRHPDSQTDRHMQQMLLTIFDSVRRRQPLRIVGLQGEVMLAG